MGSTGFASVQSPSLEDWGESFSSVGVVPAGKVDLSVLTGGRQEPAIDAPLLTVGEAAARLHVHDNTVRNWIARGVLTAVRLPGGHRRIDSMAVERVRMGILGNLAPADRGPVIEGPDDFASDFRPNDEIPS